MVFSLSSYGEQRKGEYRRKIRRKERKRKLVDSFKKCFCFAKYLLEIKIPSPCYRYIWMQELFSQIQNRRRILGYPVFNFSSHIQTLPGFEMNRFLWTLSKGTSHLGELDMFRNLLWVVVFFLCLAFHHLI